jgi:hypothetical protein
MYSNEENVNIVGFGGELEKNLLTFLKRVKESTGNGRIQREGFNLF